MFELFLNQTVTLTGLNGILVNAAQLGCKPSQDKKNENEILSLSDSDFSPDSEYGFQKS